MEPTASPSPASSEGPPRREWRALAQLRDRVEQAAAELVRLRAENEALAARVAEMEAGGGGLVPAGTDPEALKKQVRRFIEAVDQAIEAAEGGSESAPASASRS